MSTLRALDAAPDATPRTAQLVARLGPPSFGQQAPHGWPETSEPWLSTGAILTRITIPLLKPTTVFLVVFSSIGFLRIFDQVYNMTSNDPGGPLNSTKPLVLMIYQTAFSSYQMGYAAAQTVVLFTILFSISMAQLWILRSR